MPLAPSCATELLLKANSIDYVLFTSEMKMIWRIVLLLSLVMTQSAVTSAIDDLSIVLSPEVQASLEAKLNEIFEQMHTEHWRLRAQQIRQAAELRIMDMTLVQANEQMLRLSRKLTTLTTDRS